VDSTFFPLAPDEFTTSPVFERTRKASANLTGSELEYRLRRRIHHFHEKGQQFESYLSFEFIIQVLQKWNQVISAFELHLFSPFAHETVAELRTTDIDRTFRQLPSPFGRSRLLWREQYFALTQTNVAALLRDQPRAINKLAGDWLDRMKQHRTTGIVFSREILVTVFAKCIQKLRLVDAELLSPSFALVIEASRIVARLSKIDRLSPHELMKTALGLAQSRAFLRFFLVMSQFVMSPSCFEQLCSQKELKGWLLFQQAMLATLTTRPEMSAEFFEIKAALSGPRAIGA
jgi:hypothetical protein